MRGAAFKLAAAVPWAIDAQWLSTILEITAREGKGPEAVAAELGRPLENTYAVTMHGSVAVIPMTGPVMRYGSFFSDVSGATSIDYLARDLRAALEDDAVTAILFDVNSPGGAVAGVHELAEMIYAARGKKPIAAYVDHQCCSAAYWLASACETITADATAIVGSIGVVTSVKNPAADVPARQIELVSSKAKDKRPDVTTDEGKATIVSTLDAIADVFVADVARNRGVKTDVVTTKFGGGGGGVLVGEAAVAAGMIDRIGSFADAVAALSPASPSNPQFTYGVHMAQSSTASLHAPKTTSAVRADAPADDGGDDANKAKTGTKSTSEEQECSSCKASCASGAKFCSACGAAFPAKKDGDKTDDDEDEQDEEEEAKAVSGILALTGTKSSRKALGVVSAWKASHDTVLDVQTSSELDKIVASAVEQGKLPKGGSALEKNLRALGAQDLVAAKSFATSLAPIAALRAGHVEPQVNNDTALALKHKGKRFEEMSYQEQAKLHIEDPKTYEALVSDATKRGALK